MNEKELIKKIRELRQIQPRKDWVVLAKRQILGQEPIYRDPVSVVLEIFPRLFLNYRVALATFLFLGILISAAVGFAQNSLPGDLLYPIKKITEKSQAVFVSKEKQPELQLEFANRRLEELTKIAESNQGKKLAPAINEYQTSVSEVAKNLTKEEIKSNPNEIKKIVKEVKSIEKRTAEIKSLGVQIDDNIELDSALVQLIKLQVDDLEKRTLTAEQAESIGEIKADIESGENSEALEKILSLSYPQE